MKRAERHWLSPIQVHMVALALLFNLTAGFAAVPTRADEGARPIRLVAFGDSLTAGYLLAPSEGFAVQLETALRARGHAVEVANAGVSGDTTGGGLQRLAWAVPDGTDGVILELGANDALRGIEPKLARANLDRILGELRRRGMPVLIAGMKAPRNWGDAYVAEFDAMFAALAEAHEALLYPFFLEGVALEPSLNLGDGMHPNAKGVRRIVEGIMPHVEELLARARTRRAALKP